MSESNNDAEFLHELAQQLRVDAVRMSGEASSGHPTSSMSASEHRAGQEAGRLSRRSSHTHSRRTGASER